jgi:hypothetical protein
MNLSIKIGKAEDFWLRKCRKMPGMVVHVCNPSTQEAEAERSQV